MTKHQPDFIIIGAQKCGTTSLYNYLIQHPQIASATQKEVHFFDLQFAQGIEWYESQFPPTDANTLTGEASPYYIFHPLVPQRLQEHYPQVKLIALLRDPVARTISHYYHEVRLGFESLSLEAALAQETERLQGEVEKILADGTYYSFNHQHYTYLSRSIYIDQLQHWMKFFPKEQFLILESESFYANPELVVNQVFEFLGVSPYKLTNYEKYNRGDYSPVNDTLKNQLVEYFQPHNQRLATDLNQRFNWTSYGHHQNQLRGRLGQLRTVLAKYTPWTKTYR